MGAVWGEMIGGAMESIVEYQANIERYHGLQTVLSHGLYFTPSLSVLECKTFPSGSSG